jgi:hypothetical protein
MKTLLMTMALALSYTASAQWTNKTVDNGIDPTYKIAYTDNSKTQWLKLENYNNNISFYMQGFSVCDEVVDVDISFLVNGIYQKYELLDCNLTEDHETVFFVKNLKTSEMLSSFKSASSVKIRINDKTCGAGTYEFKMTGGTSAFDFVVKQ